MYLNSEQITRFLGTGAVNADGDTLSAFLEKYNPNKYQNPSNTVDTLIFTYAENEGVKTISRLLLIKRGNHPSIGWWALPGGFVEYRENIDDAALRELKEETGIDDVEICQLKSYGDYDRDPRTRIITTAYVALVPEGSLNAEAGDDASDSGWFEIEERVEACIKERVEIAESSGGSGSIEAENVSNKCSRQLHRLTLREPGRQLELTANVEVRTSTGTILPKTEYKVVDSNLLAADHGAIILEGYHFVKAQIEKAQCQADKKKI